MPAPDVGDDTADLSVRRTLRHGPVRAGRQAGRDDSVRHDAGVQHDWMMAGVAEVPDRRGSDRRRRPALTRLRIQLQVEHDHVVVRPLAVPGQERLRVGIAGDQHQPGPPSGLGRLTDRGVVVDDDDPGRRAHREIAGWPGSEPRNSTRVEPGLLVTSIRQPASAAPSVMMRVPSFGTASAEMPRPSSCTLTNQSWPSMAANSVTAVASAWWRTFCNAER